MTKIDSNTYWWKEGRIVKKTYGVVVSEQHANMMMNIIKEKYNKIKFIELKDQEYFYQRKSYGICISDKKNSVIYINRETLKELSLFIETLAHEVAHVKHHGHTQKHLDEMKPIVEFLEAI